MAHADIISAVEKGVTIVELVVVVVVELSLGSVTFVMVEFTVVFVMVTSIVYAAASYE